MSNTYGGLIFVGVKSDRKKGNIPVALAGVGFSKGDMSAHITNRILSTVHPRPEFELGILPVGAQDKFLAIIRIREGSIPPYEYTQGATVRIPVRIQDTNRQATVREFENLFTKRKTATISPDDLVSEYLQSIAAYPMIRRATGYIRAATWQRIFIVPNVSLSVRIDTTFERRFERLIAENFPKDKEYLNEEIRRAGVSIFGSSNNEKPRRWAIWSSGAIAFCRNLGRAEPVGELAAYFIFGCRLAHQFLESRHYYGSVVVAHEVYCPGVDFLPTFPEPGGYRGYDEVDGIRFPTAAPGSLPNKSVFVERSEWTDLDTAESLVATALLDQLRESRAASIQFEKLLQAINRLSQDSRNAHWGERF